VVGFVEETARTKSIALEIPGWAGHRAGQHVDVRLTAEDGYQAQRSYSIASAPEDDSVVLTVECLDDGEVSPYLTQELRAGDELELRGPIGDYFVWEEALGGPVFLIGGGSGFVPLRAIIRHHAAVGSRLELRALYSARSLPDLIYRDELIEMRERDALELHFALTRQQPPGWSEYARRIDLPMLKDVSFPPDAGSLTYICGPTGFVETAAAGLVELGHDPSRIRTERFGPSGA
jgi:ferredoxin-NADP reductase